MFCARCGNQVTEGSAFCGSCGAPVTAASAQAPAAPAVYPPSPVYGAPPPQYSAAPAVPKKRTGCIIAAVIVIVVLLCGCCGVPAFLAASGQTIDLGEVTAPDSVLTALGVDKMIEDALDTFFPWGSDDGSDDGGSSSP